MLDTLSKNWKITLGSQSPRRVELLKGLNISFTQEVRSIDETYPPSINTSKIAEYLAQKKGMEFQKELNANALVITADTIVSINDEVLEKPKDKKHAATMLSKLSGNKHTVYSSVAITLADRQISFTDATEVYFKTLEDAEIDYYLNNFKPYDKAGAYGVQEWIGYIGVEKMEGSYFTVMGLPVEKLYSELKILFKNHS